MTLELTQTTFKFRCPLVLIDYLDWKAQKDMEENPQEHLMMTKSDMARKILLIAMRNDIAYEHYQKEEELKVKLRKEM